MRDAFENKTETITFTVEEATMNKLREKFEDVNVNACPWFDVQDRYGNAARYYREDVPRSAEPRMIFEKMTDAEFEKWLYEHGICNPDINEPISCKAVPLLIDDAINELLSAHPENKKRISETAQNVSDSDLIFRKAAIDAVGKYLKKVGELITVADVVDAVVAIAQLPSAQSERIDDEEKKKRLLAEELRARKIMIEDFEGIIHDVIPEVDVYDAIEEVLGWRI